METYIAFVTIGGMPLSGEHERRLLTAIEEIKGHPGSGLKVIDVHTGGVMVVMTDQRPKEISANLGATLTRLLGEGVDVAIHRYDMVQTFIGDLEEKTDKWLEAAHSLAANGKHERALIYFEKCLTNDPENLSAMQGKARSLLVLGRVDMAVALLTKILKQDPDRPSVWKDLGMGLAHQGKHKEAVKAFDKAIVKGTASEEAGEGEFKDIAELLLLKGACLRALGKFDEALRTAEEALAEGGGVNATVEKGEVLVRMGRYKEAQELVERELGLEPGEVDNGKAKGEAADDPRLWALLGRSRLDGGDGASAEPILRAAIELAKGRAGDPGVAYRAALDLGRALKGLGRYEEALTLITESEAASRDEGRKGFLGGIPLQDKVDGLFEKADVLARLGREEEAIKVLDECVAMDGRAARTWHRRAIVLRTMGRNEDAEKAMTHAIELEPSSPTLWSERAVDLFNLGKADAALKSLEEALAKDPKDAVAWNARGTMLYTLERYGEALASYDRAISIDPEVPTVWVNRANALANMGKDMDAISSFDEAIKRDRSLMEAWRGKEIVLFDMKRFGEALECYDFLLARSPGDLELMNRKGLAQRFMGDVEGAVATFKKGLEIGRSTGGTHFELGNTFMQMGDLVAAVASYDHALEKMPGDLWALNNKGGALNRMNHFSEAERVFASALDGLDEATGPGPERRVLAELWKNRGTNLYLLERYEQAVGCFDKVLSHDERDTEAWNNKGNALSRLGRYEDALIAYGKALDIDGRNKVVLVNRGKALIETGRLDEALEGLNLALEVDPSFEDAWTTKGNVLSEKEDYKQAVSCYIKAIESNPRSETAWNNQGHAFAGMGKIHDAIRCYDMAIQLKPDYGEAWDNKGNALFSKGDMKGSIDCYRKAIEIDPGNGEAWTSLGTALYNLGQYKEARDTYTKAANLAIKAGGEGMADLADIYARLGNTLIQLGDAKAAKTFFDKALGIDPENATARDGRGLLEGLGSKTDQ